MKAEQPSSPQEAPLAKSEVKGEEKATQAPKTTETSLPEEKKEEIQPAVVETKPSLGLSIVSRPEKALESIKNQPVEKVKEEPKTEAKEKSENTKEYYKKRFIDLLPFTHHLQRKRTRRRGSLSFTRFESWRKRSKDLGDAQSAGDVKKATAESGDSRRGLAAWLQ